MPARGVIWDRLIELVSALPSKGARHLGGTVRLGPSTELTADLGLTGDDAFEFMEKFAEVFGVASGDFEFSRYFDAESLWPLPGLKKRMPKQIITLAMLESAAVAGIWQSERLQELAPEQRR